ncbi:hypothetical protein [Paenibacillus sp. S150]|uniref:hypothetical protein n=1 Tax=Paenibacillus sp. S150 TaxID=2749826 RepID=UPI001C58DBB1|nr:hypothetical protein [Paenibacillus sp. S150]MBW4081518.1 hypothetical protein [Paenibacillus sp. S150]
MTGRIFGIQTTILGVVMITAPLLGGLLVQLAGPGRIFVAFGIVQVALGLVGVLFGRLLWPVAEPQPAEASAPPRLSERTAVHLEQHS